jgi:HD-GYP domain-containing protein (c-di-GMP phosphodiesterase class II)
MARILAVVDTFDAMTQDRVYRKGLPEEVALNELRIFSGSQFDAHLVKIYLEVRPHWIHKPIIDISQHSTERIFKRAA